MKANKKTVRPEILALVELGNGFVGTKISAPTRSEISHNLQKAFVALRERTATKRT